MAVEMEPIRGSLFPSLAPPTQQSTQDSIVVKVEKTSSPGGSSPCPQSVSPHLPPTPPGSRSPPSSRLSPLTPQNNADHSSHPLPQQPAAQPSSNQRVLPFGIDNILRPDFGGNKPDYVPTTRPQTSRSSDIPDLLLRTPPKTPDVPVRHDSPVDLSHKMQLPINPNFLADAAKTNERLLSHSISLLINQPNHPINPFNPLQHHLQQQLFQHHAVSPHLQQPIITKPIPLSSTTAFQLLKPFNTLKSLTDHHNQVHQPSPRLNFPHQAHHQPQQPPPHKKHSSMKILAQKEVEKSAGSFLGESAAEKQTSPAVPIPSPTPSSCSTSSSISVSSSTTSTADNNNDKISSQDGESNKKSESLDELVNPKIPEDSSNWPAWVYCTRYSDRPSSGEISNLY